MRLTPGARCYKECFKAIWLIAQTFFNQSEHSKSAWRDFKLNFFFKRVRVTTYRQEISFCPSFLLMCSFHKPYQVKRWKVLNGVLKVKILFFEFMQIEVKCEFNIRVGRKCRELRVLGIYLHPSVNLIKRSAVASYFGSFQTTFYINNCRPQGD